MQNYSIIETKERIQADNELEAAKTREQLRNTGTFFVNVMGSPGAGKTSVIVNIIKRLSSRYRIGVMEADVDHDVDAKTISATGAKVIQLHTGGLCHMDADMTKRGLDALGTEDLDIVFLENVGNLVCPAEFDTGSNISVMILSVPEGDDKVAKYPLMFQTTDALVLNKYDMIDFFDFDTARVEKDARDINPDVSIFKVSNKSGDGLEEFLNWLSKKIEDKINA